MLALGHSSPRPFFRNNGLLVPPQNIAFCFFTVRFCTAQHFISKTLKCLRSTVLSCPGFYEGPTLQILFKKCSRERAVAYQSEIWSFTCFILFFSIDFALSYFSTSYCSFDGWTNKFCRFKLHKVAASFFFKL